MKYPNLPTDFACSARRQPMMAAALISCTLFPDLTLPFSDLRVAGHGERDALHIRGSLNFPSQTSAVPNLRRC
jgi:hypothetical protein